MEEKHSDKTLKQFVKNYISTACESKVYKFIVLTGYNINGAKKLDNEEFYSTTINCLSYINQDNYMVENKIKFFYFLDNNISTPINVEDLSVYSVKCKKVKNQELYYLLKIKKTKEKRFNSMIEEQLKSISVNIDNVLFTYDKKFAQYAGKLGFQNKKIDIILVPEKNNLDMTSTIESFRKISSNFISFCKNAFNTCSKEILKLIQNGNSVEDNRPNSEEEIKERISKNSFIIEICNNNYTIYFQDDNMLEGHTIIYHGNTDNEEFNIEIGG